MENLSRKIHRMVTAKRPPSLLRLMGWYEDALDLENACRYWEKAAELRRSKIKKGHIAGYPQLPNLKLAGAAR